MLSRVAENIYWMSRYIERAENTARLISAATNLMLDLPKGVRQGWGSLLAISGCDELYRKGHDDYGERAVLRFLIGSKENPDSILSSLDRARENCRTIRDIVPRKVWEQIICRRDWPSAGAIPSSSRSWCAPRRSPGWPREP